MFEKAVAFCGEFIGQLNSSIECIMFADDTTVISQAEPQEDKILIIESLL